LEVPAEELTGHPRTWIQLCSNDTLYSDGLCYAVLLQAAGADVKVMVEEGWPHTFWLKAPELEQSYEADERMVSGLEWIIEDI
jgi:acetyl esterase/lipase